MDPAAGPVSAIYHDVPERGSLLSLSDFAVATAKTNWPRLPHQLAMPDPSPPFGLEWYYSKASLCNISHVEICRESNWKPRCIGLLFCYDDGSREVLGQYRWDQVESYDIHHCTTVSFRWAESKHGNVYLTDIQFGPPANQSASQTQWPLLGKIEWWYDIRDDCICIDGQYVFG